MFYITQKQEKKMTLQKKDYDETDGVTEDLADSTNTPKRKKISKLVKPILITTLSALCLSGGIVLHKMHSFENQYTEPLKKQHMLKKHQPLALLKNNSLTALTSKNIENTEPQQSLPTKKTEETSSQPLSDDLSITETKAPLQKNISSIVKMDGFSLADALRFKDRFLTEDNCYEDYQKLSNATNKTPEATEVLENLYPYCIINQGAVKNVKSAFLKNKKEALIVYYRETNPLWLAYLKAIPAMLIEIRRINPQKDKPKDILYKAQNELYSQNVSKAMDLVNTLPLSMQQKMGDFFREAGIYNSAKESLDQLILSFEKQGE